MSDTMIDGAAAEAPEADSIEPLAGEGPVKDNQTPEGEAAPEGEGSSDPETLFAGKYKTLEEFEKGHKELEKAYRSKAPEVPDEYNIDLTTDETLIEEFGEDMVNEFNPAEDPRFEQMKDVFKEAGLTQDQVSALVKAQIRFDASIAPDLEAEARALGDQRDIMIANANHFVQKHLNAEEQEIAKTLGQSAAGVKFLHKLSQMTGEKPVPAKVDNIDAGPTSAELKAQAFDFKASVDNFDTNRAAQAKYDAMLTSALKKETAEQKRG